MSSMPSSSGSRSVAGSSSSASWRKEFDALDPEERLGGVRLVHQDQVGPLVGVGVLGDLRAGARPRSAGSPPRVGGWSRRARCDWGRLSPSTRMPASSSIEPDEHGHAGVGHLLAADVGLVVARDRRDRSALGDGSLVADAHTLGTGAVGGEVAGDGHQRRHVLAVLLAQLGDDLLLQADHRGVAVHVGLHHHRGLALAGAPPSGPTWTSRSAEAWERYCFSPDLLTVAPARSPSSGRRR